jgi:fructokinase
METASMDIVCLGELLIDMFPAETGKHLAEVSAFLPKPGGAPANVAVAAARLGKHSAFIGKVGDDAFGHFLIETLRDQGVETKGMRIAAEARTTMAFIAKPDAYSAEFIFYRNPGADMLLRADELEGDLLAKAKIFHFGSISLIHEPSRSATLEAVRLAKEAGALISFDVNFRPSLWPRADFAAATIGELLSEADLVKVNEEELELLTGTRNLGAGGKVILEKGPQLCVVTLGAQGSYFCSHSGADKIAPFKVETVDAVGCGDAFMAGVLCRLAGYEDWRSALATPEMAENLRFANAVGALTALRPGVIPALPSAREVASFLSEQTT